MKRASALSLALTLGALSSPAGAVTDGVTVNTDATGASCNLAVGYTETATVLHKFSIGATSVRFRLEFPDGSTFIEFNTPYSMTGSALTDMTVDYGECMLGSWPVGTFTAILTTGTVWVRPATDLESVMTRDCELNEQTAFCGGAFVGGFDPYCPYCFTVATNQSTWGAVKALYR